MNRHTLLLLALAAVGACLAFLGFQTTGAMRVVLGVVFCLFVGGVLLLDYYVLKAISGGLVPLVAGVICLALAGCLAVDHWLFVGSAVTTKSDVWMGVPTSMSLRRWQKQHTVASTKFGRGSRRPGDLVLEAGVLYEDGQGNYRWAIGNALPFAFPGEDEEVAVAYLPSDPAQARIDGWLFWHWPVSLVAAGTVFIAVGVVVLRWKRKAGGKEEPEA